MSNNTKRRIDIRAEEGALKDDKQQSSNSIAAGPAQLLLSYSLLFKSYSTL
jgi:hypothetical protein